MQSVPKPCLVSVVLLVNTLIICTIMLDAIGEPNMQNYLLHTPSPHAGTQERPQGGTQDENDIHCDSHKQAS